ncbi:hypothetical protein Godav_023140, partial [Gossypium davidsonii]|nr:hypothetical protein [Gossypium davidsonii]MBA0664131.1 hypothetical protein [Gossypium klotzschianum]
RSGQIPAFGDWDHANELPITQYFESAREAGLIRFSSSSAKPKPYLTVDLKTKHPRNHVPVRKSAYGCPVQLKLLTVLEANTSKGCPQSSPVQ